MGRGSFYCGNGATIGVYMGQARSRGNFETRKKAAQERARLEEEARILALNSRTPAEVAEKASKSVTLQKAGLILAMLGIKL